MGCVAHESTTAPSAFLDEYPAEAQRESPTNKRLAIASSINDALKFVRLRACEIKGENDAVIEGRGDLATLGSR